MHNILFRALYFQDTQKLRKRVGKLRAIAQTHLHAVDKTKIDFNRELGTASVVFSGKLFNVDLQGSGDGPYCSCTSANMSLCVHILIVIHHFGYGWMELERFGFRGDRTEKFFKNFRGLTHTHTHTHMYKQG